MCLDPCEGFLQFCSLFFGALNGDPQAVNLLRGEERHSLLYRGFQKSFALKLRYRAFGNSAFLGHLLKIEVISHNLLRQNVET